MMIAMKRLMPSMAALQCFEAVARHLSVTRAADELHLTQSAVSKQIAQLEAMLERELFRRVRKRLHLTPAGELYLSEIRKILNQVEIASRFILSYGGDTEVLTVAAPASFCSRWLIPGLKGFGARHPTIHLDIRSEQQAADIPDQRADITFFYGDSMLPRAEGHELFGEWLVPVCAPEMLAAGPVLSPEAFGSGQVLLHVSSRAEAWRTWFMSQGIDASRSYQGPRFQTFDMAICAARAGCGIAMVPQFLVQHELDRGELVLACHHANPGPGRYFVAYAEHMADTPKVRALTEWVLEKVRAGFLSRDIDGAA